MSKYKKLSEIITKRCFLDLIEAVGGKVDPKELVEVQCMYYYLTSYLMKKYKGKDNVYIYDVGCGKRPTLGAYMSLMYPHPVVCIDPQLDLSCGKNIKGLQLYKGHVQEYTNYYARILDHVIVIQNHGHAKYKLIKPLLDFAKSWDYITCPCCVDNRIPNKIATFYKDTNNVSPKNGIYHYKGINY